MKKSLLLSLLTLTALSGCVAYDPHPGYGYGPPPHAPAHGYRRHYHGYDMDYDVGLGVYVVLGHPGFYFWDDHYYRLIDGHWHLGVGFDGPWHVVDVGRMPPGLYKKYPGKSYQSHGKDYEHYEHHDKHEDHPGKGKDKHKGKGKDKHD